MATQVYTKQNQEYEATLSLASDADIVSGDYQVFASLVHEWGDTIVDEELATRDAAGEYSYNFTATDLNSFGKHKIVWKYTEGGDDFTSTAFINVYTPYITEGEFFETYPELETDFSEKFDGLERRVRSFIDTICGQNFQSIQNKSLTYEGDDHENIFLGIRCTKLISATEKPDVDISDQVEVTVESKMYMRRIEQIIPIATQEKQYIQPKFMDGSFYTFTANWGWDHVPSNITEAASLLIYDFMNDDTAYPKHGISNAKMDQYSLTFSDAAMSGTGNIEADVLLMDYTIYTMGLI